LEAEKVVGMCEAAERITGITEEHSARKFCQLVAKRAHPSSSTDGWSQKRHEGNLKLKFRYKELLSQVWAQ